MNNNGRALFPARIQNITKNQPQFSKKENWTKYFVFKPEAKTFWVMKTFAKKTPFSYEVIVKMCCKRLKLNVQGRFKDLMVTGALNPHQIWDVCISKIVLSERNFKSMNDKSALTSEFFKQIIIIFNRPYERNSRYTTYIQAMCLANSLIGCAHRSTICLPLSLSNII